MPRPGYPWRAGQAGPRRAEGVPSRMLRSARCKTRACACPSAAGGLPPSRANIQPVQACATLRA